MITGYGFMEHGYAKIAHGPDAFIQILHTLGVPAPHVLGWATIMVELLSGGAVLLGVFIPLQRAHVDRIVRRNLYRSPASRVELN